MSFFDAVRYRLSALLHPRDHTRDLDDEMRFHLELEAMQRAHRARHTDDDRAAADAPYAARRRFGNVTYYREESRRESGIGGLDVLVQDVRFALRTFRRAPTFTLVVIATLAIGIGANTAIYTVFDALLLRPLPYAKPDELMNLTLVAPARGASRANDGVQWSVPKFAALRAEQHLFRDLTIVFGSQFTMRVGDEATRQAGEVVDSRYFPTLGVGPAIGRAFVADDDRRGAARVMVLSDQFWRGQFAADPAIVGRTVYIDGSAYAIVGVMPPKVNGVLGGASFWINIAGFPAVWEDYADDPNRHSFFAVARLAPGVSAERATLMMRELGTRIDARFPDPRGAGHWSATARPLDGMRIDRGTKQAIWILFGAVGLVLLIACANVANLCLVRASGRQREIAVRLAIGASRWRIVRQLLVESLLLSSAGGAAALIVAWAGAKILSTATVIQIQGIGDVGNQSARLDGSALLFTAAIALATGIAFGLAPALQSTRPAVTRALRDDTGRESGGGRRLSGRNALIVAELALAVVLLVGSGLMIGSLRRLTDVQPGFDRTNVLTVRVNRAPEWARDSIVHFYDVALARIAAIPGVRQVAIGDCPPLSGGCSASSEVKIPGRAVVADEPGPVVGIHWITPNWPSVMRVPIVRGRGFDEHDDTRSRPVVLVSESAARRLWSGDDPIGKPIVEAGPVHDTAWVVGVVGDVRYRGLGDSLPSEIYVSYYQRPISYRMMFFVRAKGDPAALTEPIRLALREVAPGFPMYEVATMERRVSGTLAGTSAATALLSLFAVLALSLATIGTYGVISYVVTQRRREMGIRIALGATTADVVRLVVGQGMLLGAVGLIAGTIISLGATRVLRNMLFHITPTDGATYAAIFAVLTVAVTLASFVPARRAASVPAMTALRVE